MCVCVCVCVCEYTEVEEAELGIFSYNNRRPNYQTRLILILKNKQQNKKIDTKLWPPSFSIIVLTRLRNDLHAFKINSSVILFNSS